MTAGRMGNRLPGLASWSAIPAKLGPPLRRIHRAWVAEPIDAFLPPRPPFDTPDPSAALVPGDEPHCPRCGRTTAPESISPRGCPTCRGHPLPWQRVARLGAYADPLAGHLKEFKFAQHWRVAEPLGVAMADRLAPSIGPAAPSVVTWVPLHWTRRWRRGYDQSRLLAEAVAQRLGRPALPTLRRVRRTPPQSLLTEAQRRRNVTAAAFAARPIDLAGHRVLLVDDVMTTGATAAACCRLLTQMKAAEITLAVVAITQRNRPPLK